MLSEQTIRDYAEEYIENSGQSVDDFDLDAVISVLDFQANTVLGVDDMDSFPNQVFC
jgi:hypothetical protein